MDEALARSLEALLAIAAGARLAFTREQRSVFEQALLILEERRYAAEDESVRRKLALLGHDIGPARRAGGAGERRPVGALDPAA